MRLRRKTKHCCGQRRDPSDEQLARAHVAQLFHESVDELHGLADRALDRLSDGLLDLPALDLSLLITLPKLIGPASGDWVVDEDGLGELCEGLFEA